MTKPYEIITELASTNSRLEKIAILQRVAGQDDGNSDFFAGVRLALDKDTKFYIKQVPEKVTHDGSGLQWHKFVTLANTLSSRAVTGHAALEVITECMDQATFAEWNVWYRPILRKDLRCGLDLSTLTAALGKESEHAVDSFKCMLAKDSKGKLPKVLAGYKAIEIKYDGVRTLAVYDQQVGKVVLYSRSGKVFRNFTKIEESLNALVADKGYASFVLDGEIVSASFNSLMTQVNRKEDANADDALYVVFDRVSLEKFLEGSTTETYTDRRTRLCNFLDEEALKAYTNLTHTTPVYIDFNRPDAMVAYDELKKKVLDAGYEGLIIKDPRAGYICKRSDAWYKVKPFIEVTLTVVGAYEGQKGTKYEGHFGGMTCKGTDDGKLITVNVGSGFSDVQREDFWQNRAKLVGMLAEIRADAVSKDSEGNYSLRFPRFKCFRGFKAGEKL